jgi:FkbM family methyltransferase
VAWIEPDSHEGKTMIPPKPTHDSLFRATSVARNLVRPQYLFRPTQIVRRVAFELKEPEGEAQTRLPWGPTIAYSPNETIGQALARRGVYDFLLCEVLLRLTDAGETAIDVGANIGHMSSLLATVVGPSGTVVVFEPHPAVFKRLSRNLAEWEARGSMGRFEPHRVALSDRDGTALLATDNFETNQGSATLEQNTVTQASDARDVVTRRLDGLIEQDRLIGVMKIDVEGHERKVLEGAERMLSSRSIRDILFEEHNTPPSPVTELLERHGYTILRFDEHLFGPVIRPGLSAARTKRPEEPSLLATLAPQRARARLDPRGWAIYGIGPAGRAAPRHR